MITIEFLAGALTLAYVLSGVYFLRFWRKTRDPLFLNFAFAFWLFAINQTIISLFGAADESSGYAYILRVVGFVLILTAILGKNIFALRRQ